MKDERPIPRPKTQIIHSIQTLPLAVDSTTMDKASAKRPRVLLGITGSVASVKGPRLALMLSQKLKAHVKVILTRTVEQSFWKEGGVTLGYDEEAWIEFWEAVRLCKDASMDGDDDVFDSV